MFTVFSSFSICVYSVSEDAIGNVIFPGKKEQNFDMCVTLLPFTLFH